MADADLEEFRGGALPSAKCISIGCFAEGNVPFLLSLSNLTGLIMFEVTFGVDVNGILTFSADDKSIQGRCRRGHQPYESDPSKGGLLTTTLEGNMLVAQGRSHRGLADRPSKPTEPPYELSLPSRTFLDEEEEELPRVGSCRLLS